MKWIFRSAVVFALAAQLVGCTEQPEPTYSNSAGSVAISRDDSLLFAVDEDNEKVAIIDISGDTEKKIAEVKVGSVPTRIIAAPDNTLYISNRGSRSVSVVKNVDGAWAETAKIETAVEPNGLALSPDSKTLYVVNATSLDSTDFGTLMAVDTNSLQPKWELPVGEEPRGIALAEGGNKALISLFKRGDLVQVDLTKPQVVKSPAQTTQAEVDAFKQRGEASGTYFKANRTALTVDPSTTSSFSSGRPIGTTSRFQARSAADVITTPDGQRAFVPVVWSRQDSITAPPTVFGGYYGSGGPCSIGAIATAGIVTVEANSGETQVDDLTACGSSGEAKDYPTTALTNGASSVAIQGPVTGVVDPTGEWLYVVNRETNNVAIMPTSRRVGDDLIGGAAAGGGPSIRRGSPVPVGKGPNGIALTRDGTRAYVYNQFDHSLSRLEGRGEGASATVSSSTIKDIFPEVLPEEVAIGRKLFFAADSTRMTAATTGTSCNTCHIDAREDGHVWMFPDGPRQTPSLAGRKLLQTAPFHWSGEFADLQEFMSHTVQMRMGGTLGTGVTTNIAAYLDVVKAPDNPFKKAVPDEKQIRGAQVFQKAQCNSCHMGETFASIKTVDVGTKVIGPTGMSTSVATVRGDLHAEFNTPSLLGLARTAPYLHDGSAGTLKQRLMANKSTNKHGMTAELTDAEMDDLVAYLNSL